MYQKTQDFFQDHIHQYLLNFLRVIFHFCLPQNASCIGTYTFVTTKRTYKTLFAEQVGTQASFQSMLQIQWWAALPEAKFHCQPQWNCPSGPSWCRDIRHGLPFELCGWLLAWLIGWQLFGWLCVGSSCLDLWYMSCWMFCFSSCNWQLSLSCRLCDCRCHHNESGSKCWHYCRFLLNCVYVIRGGRSSFDGSYWFELTVCAGVSLDGHLAGISVCWF